MIPRRYQNIMIIFITVTVNITAQIPLYPRDIQEP
jgi:hypothetical protein